MKTRAAIYVRVSRAYKKDDDRVTIEAQLADCESYCKKHGYSIVARYVDKDKYRAKGALVNPSGERKDRPGYRSMLAATKNNEFDVIIAWKEDRLYRGLYAALPLAEILDEKRSNLTVELVMETFDRQMLGIKAAIAKLELDNIRDRMLMGRKIRIERGEVPGGPVRYGYQKNDERRMVINEAEANIVRQVFDWYIMGENNMEIRRRLNASGALPRKNKIWPKATINNILTFEGYAVGEYKTTLRDEEFMIPCPTIISIGVWEKACEIRKQNKSYRGRNVKEDYLCRGMIVCPCGWKWTARTSHSNKKASKSKCGYYGCALKDHKPEHVHNNCPGTIGSQKLDNFVWNFVTNICKEPDIIQNAIDVKISMLQDEQGNIEDELVQLQNELDKFTDERQWIITTARKGAISEDDMSRQLAAVDLQALELRKKRSDKIATVAIQNQADRLKEWANQYIRNVANGLRVLTTDISDMSDAEINHLYETLAAHRYDKKFNGDKTAALNWSILEEKRRTVRMLISQVLVVKGEDGRKEIFPQLAFEVPEEFVSLVYNDQSLAYVEGAREFSDGD
ncbi:MAG: recombinase family protein [Anaerolineales bacterium]|nr:recombinase family protein [Candidatus Brocadiales bacterium]MBL6983023.1 recombinase family protein [Anaerolineales bacterium]